MANHGRKPKWDTFLVWETNLVSNLWQLEQLYCKFDAISSSKFTLIYQICNSTGQNIGHNDGEYRFSNNNKVLVSNMGLTIREKLMGNSLDVMT